MEIKHEIKLVLVLIVSLILFGCNMNNSSEELEKDNKKEVLLKSIILSGYENIDNLVIDKI